MIEGKEKAQKDVKVVGSKKRVWVAVDACGCYKKYKENPETYTVEVHLNYDTWI